MPQACCILFHIHQSPKFPLLTCKTILSNLLVDDIFHNSIFCGFLGNCGPRCCPLECFMKHKDPGRVCCDNYPSCSCRKCCRHYPSCDCRCDCGLPSCRKCCRSPCHSDSSCDDPCFNKRPNEFRTPPVLVYRYVSYIDQQYSLGFQ